MPKNCGYLRFTSCHDLSLAIGTSRARKNENCRKISSSFMLNTTALALWVSEVGLHVHAIMKNTNHNNLGARAGAVENYMAALTKFPVSRLYFFSILVNFGLA